MATTTLKGPYPMIGGTSTGKVSVFHAISNKKTTLLGWSCLFWCCSLLNGSHFSHLIQCICSSRFSRFDDSLDAVSLYFCNAV